MISDFCSILTFLKFKYSRFVKISAMIKKKKKSFMGSTLQNIRESIIKLNYHISKKKHLFHSIRFLLLISSLNLTFTIFEKN